MNKLTRIYLWFRACGFVHARRMPTRSTGRTSPASAVCKAIAWCNRRRPEQSGCGGQLGQVDDVKLHLLDYDGPDFDALEQVETHCGPQRHAEKARSQL